MTTPALSGARPRRRATAVLAALGAGLLASVTAAVPASADVATTPLTTESFTGSSVADEWVLPARATNRACLTAGSATTSTPIPGCPGGPLDAAGSGTLRLTTNDNDQVGSVYNSVSLPTSRGLDISFNTFQYFQDRVESPYTEGADGISFILAATDPADPAPPSTKGALGGSLGYSSSGHTPGVSYGYLGFGIDVYGNFLSSDFGGLDCGYTPRGAQNIGIRGPGNGTSGYCLLGSTELDGAGLDKQFEETRPAAVPVEVVLNPSLSTVTSSGGLSVAPRTLTLRVGTYEGSKTITTALPTLDPADYPAGWVDAESGLPHQLTFGWGASTGGSNEIHEIGQLRTETLTGRLPVYSLGVPGNGLSVGAPGTVRVSPALASGQGSEAETATVTTTLPTGIVPAAGPTTTANGYSCTATGQVSRCRYTPPTAVPAGAALPALDVPVTVAPGTALGSHPVTAKVSSVDGKPATATGSVTVTLPPPGAPTDVTATADESAVLVSWKPPTTGQPVARYRVTASPGSASCETTGLSCVLGGEAGVGYTITVVPVTADGVQGAPATTTTSGTVAPPAVPDAPPADALLTLTTTDGPITTAEPGQQITVVGTGFLPYSTARIVVYSTPVVLGTATTDASGAFRKTVTIPADLEPGAHALMAYGVDPSGHEHSLRLDITVAAAGPVTGTTGTPAAPVAITARSVTGPSLAYTGSTLDPLPVALAGGVLLAAGGALLVVVRSRRNRREGTLSAG